MLKTLSIDELEVGMYVIDIILKDSDQKVKNQGIVKSENTIAQLKKQGVARVVIEIDADNENVKASVEPEISDETTKEDQLEQTSLIKEFSQSCDLYDQANEKIKISARGNKTSSSIL